MSHCLNDFLLFQNQSPRLDALFFIVLCCVCVCVVTWNFDDGMEGWANATAEEMRAVFWSSGGELRGRMMQNTYAGDLPPHFDSPFFNIDMRDQETDKHHLVFRMKYRGKFC